MTRVKVSYALASCSTLGGLGNDAKRTLGLTIARFIIPPAVASSLEASGDVLAGAHALDCAFVVAVDNLAVAGGKCSFKALAGKAYWSKLGDVAAVASVTTLAVRKIVVLG